MNSLVRQDFLINQRENVYEFFESLFLNSFIVLILIDYIVYRFQTMGKIKMLEKNNLDNKMQITRGINKIHDCLSQFEELSKVLAGLCGTIDNKILDIKCQIQEDMNNFEKKLKNLINSELDNIDDGYDNLSRKLVLLQSSLSEYYEKNTDQITALEQKHIDFQTMITEDLDVIQKYTLSLSEECKRTMDEWSGSRIDSKICDLYCCVRAAFEGNSIQRTILHLIEVNFPHIKFNEIPNDVCVRNLKLVNPTHSMFSNIYTVEEFNQLSR